MTSYSTPRPEIGSPLIQVRINPELVRVRLKDHSKCIHTQFPQLQKEDHCIDGFLCRIVQRYDDGAYYLIGVDFGVPLKEDEFVRL